jgi:lysophospholipase L1-like esterase
MFFRASETAKDPMMKNPRVHGVVVCVVSSSAVVLILELLMRTFFHHGTRAQVKFINYAHTPSAEYRASDITGYELIPNATPDINSFGMRDKEYPLTKDAHAYRILVLGDSITFPNLYPAMMENTLNQLKHGRRHYEVLNAGLGGIGVRQYAQYAEKRALRYSPDMIFIGLCLNDLEVWAPVLYKARGDLIEYHNPFPMISRALMNRFLFRHSALYRFLMLRIELLLYSRHRDVRHVETMIDEGIYYLRRIKRLCAANNIALAGAVFPYLKHPNDYSPQDTADYQSMKEVLTRVGVTYLDLGPAFLQSDIIGLRETVSDYVHPNLRGHAIAAQEITRFLLDRPEVRVSFPVKEEGTASRGQNR